MFYSTQQISGEKVPFYEFGGWDMGSSMSAKYGKNV